VVQIIIIAEGCACHRASLEAFKAAFDSRCRETRRGFAVAAPCPGAAWAAGVCAPAACFPSYGSKTTAGVLPSPQPGHSPRSGGVAGAVRHGHLARSRPGGGGAEDEVSKIRFPQRRLGPVPTAPPAPRCHQARGPGPTGEPAAAKRWKSPRVGRTVKFGCPRSAG